MIARFVLALFLLAGAAQAQTASAPGRAAVDGDLACGGQSNSPACAVALFFACAARLSDETCATVGLSEIPKVVEQPQPLEFAIERTSTIRPEDINDDTRHLSWFRPGFLLVEAQMRRCPAEGSCAEESWDDWQVYLREADGRFLVVYWRGDSTPDQPPEIPEAFLPAAPAPQ
ncbi:MAG: hypothetical protein JNL71_13625 [Rhodospirillales bacterium]|nr:hypothetical protein [Rhodospirillales bacterium]